MDHYDTEIIMAEGDGGYFQRTSILPGLETLRYGWYQA